MDAVISHGNASASASAEARPRAGEGAAAEALGAGLLHGRREGTPGGPATYLEGTPLSQPCR